MPLQFHTLSQHMTLQDPNIKLEPLPAAQTTPAANLHTVAGKPTPYLVTGLTPKDARPGDIYTATITAHCPQTPSTAGRAVQFTQTIHIQG